MCPPRLKFQKNYVHLAPTNLSKLLSIHSLPYTVCSSHAELKTILVVSLWSEVCLIFSLHLCFSLFDTTLPYFLTLIPISNLKDNKEVNHELFIK